VILVPLPIDGFRRTYTMMSYKLITFPIHHINSYATCHLIASLTTAAPWDIFIFSGDAQILFWTAVN